MTNEFDIDTLSPLMVKLRVKVAPELAVISNLDVRQTSSLVLVFYGVQVVL